MDMQIATIHSYVISVKYSQNIDFDADVKLKPDTVVWGFFQKATPVLMSNQQFSKSCMSAKKFAIPNMIMAVDGIHEIATNTFIFSS